MKEKLKYLIEALIFVSPEPLNPDKIKAIFNELEENHLEEALNALIDEYNSGHRGIRIGKYAGGYCFETNPEYEKWVKLLLSQDKKGKLSPASLETLSTIAYHQPITQAEVSAMRGVDSTHSLKTLLYKKLIKITGRRKSPGKPLIYRTSDNFLSYFGLESLNELPSKQEIEKILETDQNET